MEFTDRYYSLLWINLSLAYIMEYSYFNRNHQFSIKHIFHYWVYSILYSNLKEYLLLQGIYMWSFIWFSLYEDFVFTTIFSWILTHIVAYYYFYARSFYNIFYTSIFGVWSTTSFMIPNFIFSLDHLSLSTINPWRFL